jgi:trigger factor
MYTFKRKNLPKQTIELTISVPKEDIESEYKKAIADLQKELTVQGFRKGKVPKDIAEKNMPREDVYDKLIRNYMPNVYSEIIKKEDLKPIISPRVELSKAKEGEDWEVKITTAESPKVTLGKYKEKVKAAKSEAKKNDIWVPGKDKEPTKEDAEKQKQAEFQAALDAIMKEAKVEISDLILEEELQKRLARLLDEMQKVGLTMDSYLQSRNLTKESLQEQIKKEIEDSYKIEFILQEIADAEDIKIEQAELEKLFANVKKDEERKAIEQNAYYYAALLRKQKTLDYLNSL